MNGCNGCNVFEAIQLFKLYQFFSFVVFVLFVKDKAVDSVLVETAAKKTFRCRRLIMAVPPSRAGPYFVLYCISLCEIHCHDI